MACTSGLCLGTKWVKASECDMLGPWRSRGRLLRQVLRHPQPSNPGRLEPSASLMEGFSAPQKLHSLVPSDAHFHPEAAALLLSRHPIPRKERVPEPCLSEALGKGAVSTEHCFPNKTILIKPRVPSYKSFGFAPLLCSLAATTQSLCPDVDLQFPSFLCCSTCNCKHLSAVISQCGKQTEHFYSQWQRNSPLFLCCLYCPWPKFPFLPLAKGQREGAVGTGEARRVRGVFKGPSTGEDDPGMQKWRLIKMNENYFYLFKQLYNHILIKIILKCFFFFW